MKVTILFDITLLTKLPEQPVSPICDTWSHGGSYVDSPAFLANMEEIHGGDVCLSNVPGWGCLAGLAPMGNFTGKLAWIERAYNAAVAAKAAGKDVAPKVEFEISGSDEQLYWLQIKDLLADQGFTIDVPDGVVEGETEGTEENPQEEAAD